MSVLDVQGLTKAFGERVLLSGVDLSLQAGERVGLLGRNGCGKSTLGRLLAGLEPPDGGQIACARGARIAYLAQQPELPLQWTALEVALSGLTEWFEAKRKHDAVSAQLADAEGDVDALLQSQAEAATQIERHGGWELTHRAEAILTHLGLASQQATLSTLSGGERRRVALARILVAEPDLAILDEPTNHLDAETIGWLEQYLRSSFKGTLLLITHDRYVLDRVVQRTLELHRGELYSYRGGYRAYLEAKAERLAQQARENDNRARFLRRELEWLRRSPKARTTKQKARVQRAQSALQATPPPDERSASLEATASHSGKLVLELRGVRVELGQRTLIDGLDLYLSAGERLGIVGPNGAGKTTLLRTMLGELRPTNGEVSCGARDIAYLSQTREGLDLEASVLDNVAQGRTRIDVGDRSLDVRSYLARFLFESHQLAQPVGALSGGERARVALARLLCRPAALLVLDEPTNDLDVEMLSSLEDLLLSFGATAIVVTHDRWFLDRVASRILAATGGGRWLSYAGNYSDYLSQRAQEPPPDSVEEPAKPKASAQRPARRKSGLTYAERLELEGLVAQVEEADARVSELETQLSDPTLYRERGAEVAALQEALAGARTKAADLMARWEWLEEKKDTV